ncbi:MAG: hypothetical protein WDZ49_10170 [Litorilinea sp.]
MVEMVTETGAPESDGQADMPSSEERLFILRMLEQGKIKAEEAARLLSALDGDTPSTAAPPRDPFDLLHGLRIRVQDMHSGHEQVNITIPTGLVRFGLRFVPHSANIDVDAIQAAVERGSVGKILEVADQDSGKRVQIFIE